MSLEGIVSEYRQPPYRVVLDEYRRIANRLMEDIGSYVKQAVGKEIPVVFVRGSGLEQITTGGGAIYKDGRTEGSPAAVAGAKKLYNDYHSFKSTEAGRELIKRYGNVEFDGYIYDDLSKYTKEGNRALAAVIETDGKKYLAINSTYANRLDDMAKLYVLAHEHVHGTGERSEKGTDSKLKKVFSDLAAKAKSWYEQHAYKRLAAEADLRAQLQPSY